MLNAEGGKFLAAVCLPLARVQTAECQQVETKRLWLQRQGRRERSKVPCQHDGLVVQFHTQALLTFGK